MINSLTAYDERDMQHTVSFIYKRLYLEHCLTSVSYIFLNKHNCSFTMEFRVIDIKLYIEMAAFSTDLSAKQLFVSTIV